MDSLADKTVVEIAEPDPLGDALTTAAASADPDGTFAISLDQIAELDNDRSYTGLDELAASMHSQGQLEPCVVRPAPKNASHGKAYELVFGYRRKRAAELLREREKGFNTLRCEVRDLSDEQALEANIVENYHRETPSAIQQARSMQRLIQECGLTKAEVGRRLAIDSTQVIHRLKLLTLPASIQQKVETGQLSASVARVITTLDDVEAQEKLASVAQKHDFTVKKAEEWALGAKANEANSILQSGQPPIDLGQVTVKPVTNMKRLTLPEPVDPETLERLSLFVMLRGAHDYEMLDYIEEVFGYSYENLWSYVRGLSATDARTLSNRIVLRNITSPHQYLALGSELLADFEEVKINFKNDLPPGYLGGGDLEDFDVFMPGDPYGEDLI